MPSSSLQEASRSCAFTAAGPRAQTHAPKPASVTANLGGHTSRSHRCLLSEDVPYRCSELSPHHSPLKKPSQFLRRKAFLTMIMLHKELRNWRMCDKSAHGGDQHPPIHYQE